MITTATRRSFLIFGRKPSDGRVVAHRAGEAFRDASITVIRVLQKPVDARIGFGCKAGVMAARPAVTPRFIALPVHREGRQVNQCNIHVAHWFGNEGHQFIVYARQQAYPSDCAADNVYCKRL